MSWLRKVPKKTVVGAAAALVAASLNHSIPNAKHFEGSSNTVYLDVAGIKTWCYGETELESGHKYYSDTMCEALLSKRMSEFTWYVEGLTGTSISPQELAAYSDLAYNIGKGGFKGSTVLKRFKEGDRAGACHAIRMWNKTRINGKLVVSKGLDNRRKANEELCLTGVN